MILNRKYSSIAEKSDGFLIVFLIEFRELRTVFRVSQFEQCHDLLNGLVFGFREPEVEENDSYNLRDSEEGRSSNLVNELEGLPTLPGSELKRDRKGRLIKRLELQRTSAVRA